MYWKNALECTGISMSEASGHPVLSPFHAFVYSSQSNTLFSFEQWTKIETIRLITFPESRACKNIYIIGRNAFWVKQLFCYVKVLKKRN